MQLIEEFCTRLSLAFEKRDGEKNKRRIGILSQANKNKSQAITSASMLLGSFLILRRGFTMDAVMAAFQDLSDQFVPITCLFHPEDEIHPAAASITVHDCWRALAHALRLGWLLPPSSDEEPVLDVDELLHYARAANGGVRVVVPGALLFFPTPSDDVPDGQEWADSVAADGRTARRFSPGYYASLLPDLGVSEVVCLGQGSAAAARALAGLALLDLLLHPPANGAAADASAAGALLPALDRLLALARGAPGAVAVHCGAGRAWPAWSLDTLARAFLISRFGFSGAEAAAWVHLVTA